MSSQKENFFNLHDESQGLHRVLAEGLNTRIFAGDQAMVSVVTVEPGAMGTMHHHPEEQWGLLLEGSVTRYQGDEIFEVSAGDFWRTPGGVPHTMKGGPNGAKVLDIFAPPREAYKKAGSGFASD